MNQPPANVPAPTSRSPFRWRGREVSRIEALTDIVFAFAITLLVVSLEVPDSFDALILEMKGFGAFAASFALLMGIWYAHYTFFRNYALNDATVLVLNTVLVFLVLFYIYPLKYLFTLLINELLLERALGIDVGSEIQIHAAQAPVLMVIYSSGFLLICLVFALMYLHAYRQREFLELDPAEAWQTKMRVHASLICAAFALLSVALAGIGGLRFSALAGWIYFFIWPVQMVHVWIMDHRAPEIAN